MNFKILVINLDRATERWDAASRQLTQWRSHVERISAADAKQLPEAILNQHYSLEGNKKCYHKLLTGSEKGCYLSHIRCWQKIIEEELDFAIILEDDFILTSDLSRLIKDIQQIHQKWHYLKLKMGKPRSVIAQQDIDHFTLLDYSKNPISAMAQAVSREGALLLLEKTLPFKRPIDVDLQYTWELGIKAQGIHPYYFEENKALGSQISDRKQVPANLPRRLKLAASFWLRNTTHNVQTYGITATISAKKWLF